MSFLITYCTSEPVLIWKEKFGTLVNSTIGEAKLGSPNVFTVRETDNILWAFRDLRLKVRSQPFL